MRSRISLGTGSVSSPPMKSPYSRSVAIAIARNLPRRLRGGRRSRVGVGHGRDQRGVDPWAPGSRHRDEADSDDHGNRRTLLYGQDGWFEGWFADHEIDVLFALPAMVIATIFVSIPFVAREVVPTLREIGDDQEQAARTLGASRWQTFWRITLPSIRWAVIYGVIVTTARCLGEYGAVAVVSGRIQGETETATLRVQERYESFDLAGAYAISIVLALMAILLLVAMTVIRPREETA
ncbi:MAG: ABC transporter permease subunit [Actinobacteria bacterium]|nr:ABC transporter permease subunit [Actinomycetota bacterium]